MWPFTSEPTASGSGASQTPTDATAPASACPVDHTTRERWLAEDPAQRGRTPAGQPVRAGLSTEREVSSIPRWLPGTRDESQRDTSPASTASSAPDATACPARSAPVSKEATNTVAATPLKEPIAGQTTQENWVYPSPASFYAALERKNRNPRAQDMGIVVPIHNAVNERCWHQILEWEREAVVNQGGDPSEVESKLVSFIGKPKQLSPRARWKTFIGYTAPFDRHDWIVDRPVIDPANPSAQPTSSQRIRYVIDFYTGRGAGLLGSAGAPPASSADSAADNFRPNLAFFIDCRPALDDFEGVRMRFNRWWSSWSSSSTTGQQQTRRASA